jgi:hypothetical protein
MSGATAHVMEAPLPEDPRSANLPKQQPEDETLAHWIPTAAALLALALLPGAAFAVGGAGDVAAQQAFMHPNYILNGPANEVMRKAQVVEMLGQGAMARTAFERIIEGLQITGDVGIVMGRETVVPAAGSQLGKLHGEGVLQRRFTNVFLFENGRWRFLARQATVVVGPGPTAAKP